MVEKLVTAAQNTGADIVTCMQIFMPEHRRHEAWPSPGLFANKLDHHPLGAGPLSLAPVENVFGPATALFSRRAFDRVGGYTELQGVGHEDYELFLKAAQADLRIELCPFPLYLYEVGRSSMISQTPVQRNFGRVTNAIDMARQSGVSMYEAKMRNNLGLVLLLDSRLEDARREFGLALGLVENKLGRENKLYKTIEGNFRRAQAA